ncbi:AAA family ATPase [Klebsiella sp. JB_Kp010]|uniref:AAA family ATPase n=1 Tax=Klebsiella TaxID=570 RepID=UPI001C22D5D8|nr:AAA family ATPase [Klebsiella variicola]MBU9734306.1 ATP-binding protein [Klebsiella variicola]
MKPYSLVKYAVLDGVKIPISEKVDLDGNYLSVIVGKNGSGKSRLLRNIALSIIVNSRLQISDGQISPDVDMFRLNDEVWFDFDLSRVIGSVYISGDHENEFWPESGGEWYQDYRRVSKTAPANVICISNSFFHKFPSNEEWPLLYFRLRRGERDIYKNLCLTELYNDTRHSKKTISNMFLLRALTKSLVDDKDSLTNTLTMLNSFGGYDGVQISFHLHEHLCVFNLNEYNTSVEKFRESLVFIDLFRYSTDDELRDVMSKIHLFLELVDYKVNVRKRFDIDESEDVLETDTYQYCFKYNKCSSTYSFFMNENGDSSIISEELKSLIVFFNDNHLLTVTDVNFIKSSRKIPFGNLSSGELNILTSLVLINSEIKDCSIVLIDEPEINLHPKWQEDIIPTLMNCFSHITGCHFIVATHSPLVASSVKEENSSVVIIDENKENTLIIPGKLVKGKSSDFQLFYTLKYPGPHNEYLIRRLLTIIAKRKNGSDISREDILLIRDASELLYDVSDGDEVKYLLAQALALI